MTREGFMFSGFPFHGRCFVRVERRPFSMVAAKGLPLKAAAACRLRVACRG
jgi:hypothetical protein